MKILRFIKRIYRTVKERSNYDIWRRLQFDRDADRRWYVNLPWWPFKRGHLEMVSGSADFLDWVEQGRTPMQRRSVIVHFCISNSPKHFDYDIYEAVRVSSKFLKGAFYEVKNAEGFNSRLYLCPVTLFVLGRYPKYIYIKPSMIVRNYSKLSAE